MDIFDQQLPAPKTVRSATTTRSATSVLDSTPKPQSPDLQAMYTKWQQNPTPHTTGQLMTTAQPIIDRAIQHASGKNNDLLRSRAKVLILEALPKYDPARGPLEAHFTTYLQRLKREQAKLNQPVRLSERHVLARQELIQAEHQLADELGRDPTDAEIADRLHMPMTQLAKLRRLPVAVHEGTFSKNMAGGEEAVLPDAKNVFGEDDETAWQEFVYGDLTDTDQLIMGYLLGMHGLPKLPLTAIAKRLNMSPAAVSQRAAKIQAKLDERTNLGLF